MNPAQDCSLVGIAGKVALVTDGRALTFTRYMQPEPRYRRLLDQLRLQLPAQPPPRNSATQVQAAAKIPAL